jgi:proteasome lid subunit RPN8/RPN11
MLSIQQSELERLRHLAEMAYPDEFCAILVGRQLGTDSRVTAIIPCRNQHPDPRRGYVIAPEALVCAQRDSRRDGLELLGFVHSHPDHPAEPSAADRQQAYWPGRVYGIISVVAGQCAAERFYRFQNEAPDAGSFEPIEVVYF